MIGLITQDCSELSPYCLQSQEVAHATLEVSCSNPFCFHSRIAPIRRIYIN